MSKVSKNKLSFEEDDDSSNSNKDDLPILKAVVSEENGEISCSIEETNRIRALLGLKPLNINGKSKQKEAIDNFEKKREEEKRQKDSTELRSRLEKAQNKRLLNEKLSGQSLGSVSDETESAFLSPAEWVQRSRQKAIEMEELKKKLESESIERKKLQSDSNYQSSDLAGLSLMHGAKDFETGEEVVLTLADSSILEKDDHGFVLGLNQAEDQDRLQNVNLADDKRRREREERVRRSKLPAYQAYDDAEFEELGGTAGARVVLAQYDEDKIAKEKANKPLVRLGEGGTIQMSQGGEEEEDQKKVKEKKEESLRTERRDLNDFYSPQEFASFNKAKAKKKIIRKVKKREAEEGEGEGGEGGDWRKDDEQSKLSEEKGWEEEADSTGDRGSRSRAGGGGRMVVDSEKEKERERGYQEALRRAEEKTVRSFSSDPWGAPGSSTLDGDVERSLARARALERRRNEVEVGEGEGSVLGQGKEGPGQGSGMDLGASMVSRLISQYKTSTPSLSVPQGPAEGFGVDAEGRRADGSLIFSSTTEFTTRLQARLNEKARSRAEAAVQGEEREEGERRKKVARKKDEVDEDEVEEEEGSGVQIKRRKEVKVEGGEEEENTPIEAEEMSEDGEDEDEDGEEEGEGEGEGIRARSREEGGRVGGELDFLHRQPLVRSGMAATLSLLRNSKELSRANELCGRALDGRELDPSNADSEIQLEYRDKSGRKLTPKEAYRQLSYKFHGYGPSKKKLEKRLKARSAQDRTKSTQASEALTMASLSKAQEATGSAYITIQGGTNSLTQSAAAEMAKKMMKNKNKQANKPK